jgi:hypothetical protein
MKGSELTNELTRKILFPVCSNKKKVGHSCVTLMMDALSTCEASVSIYHITWRRNPEDGHLHTRRRQNLKSQQKIVIFL